VAVAVAVLFDPYGTTTSWVTTCFTIRVGTRGGVLWNRSVWVAEPEFVKLLKLRSVGTTTTKHPSARHIAARTKRETIGVAVQANRFRVLLEADCGSTVVDGAAGFSVG